MRVFWASFLVLTIAVGQASAAGFRVVDTTIDPASNQQILVEATGTGDIDAMDLYVQVSGTSLILTGIEITGTLWADNNDGPWIWVDPAGDSGCMYVMTLSGTVSCPGSLAVLVVDATGLGGQTATITANPTGLPSAFGLATVDGYIDGTITIRSVDPPPTNHPPFVNAGPDQVVTSGTQVNLAGAAWDADGDELTYSWTQVTGPTVSLSSAAVTNPTFVAPEVASQTLVELQLRVSDGKDARTDTVGITVNPQATNDTTDTPADSQDSSSDTSTDTSNDVSTDDSSGTTSSDGTQTGDESEDGTTGTSTPACAMGFSEAALMVCTGFWLMLLRPLRRADGRAGLA